jgi:cytochrome c-type biogenesis protein
VTDISVALAIAAGALSFLSPCVLALLPVYLAFLGEAAVAPSAAGSSAAVASRGSVVPQALLFVIGFSVLFVVVGTSIGLFGAPLFRIPVARQAAGIAVIALGIVSTGAFGPILDRFRIGLDPAALPTARSVRALALGAFVAIGWTPCIGPVLGAILTMGASSGSTPVVALLLAAYSVGLAIPFLAAAVAFPRLRPLVEVLRRHHRVVEVVSGLLIVVIGVLIFLNAFERLASLFTFVL